MLILHVRRPRTPAIGTDVQPTKPDHTSRSVSSRPSKKSKKAGIKKRNRK